MLRLDSKIRKWCIFTSAGDVNNIRAWIDQTGDPGWDLIIAFYGTHVEVEQDLRSVSDTFIKIQGGKFQNLNSIYTQSPEIFSNYEYILVADDDLIMGSLTIRRAFELAELYDLWVCQPAFDNDGKVSHSITRQSALGTRLRLVNFVETTCPIFRADKLKRFLEVFDGSLTGWGIDWWYCNLLKSNFNRKFAILDELTVINPHDCHKPGALREITKLQSNESRENDWSSVKKKLSLEEFEHRVFDHVVLDGPWHDYDYQKQTSEERVDVMKALANSLNLKPTSMDTQEAGLPGFLSISCIHPNWKGILYLSQTNNRFIQQGTAQSGYYWIDGICLHLQWIAFPKETFVLQDGDYVHHTLAAGRSTL